jgi:hypothetical protein
MTMVCLMVPLCILGRVNYRKISDGAGDVTKTRSDILLDDKLNGVNVRDANSNEKS